MAEDRKELGNWHRATNSPFIVRCPYCRAEDRADIEFSGGVFLCLKCNRSWLPEPVPRAHE